MDEELFMFDTLRIRFGNEPLHVKVRWIDLVLAMSDTRGWGPVAETVNPNYDRYNEEEVNSIVSLLLPEVISSRAEAYNRRRWIAQNEEFLVGYPLDTEEERMQSILEVEQAVRRARHPSLCSRVSRLGKELLWCKGKRTRRSKKRRNQRKGKSNKM
jgi:hypothetical protein